MGVFKDLWSQYFPIIVLGVFFSFSAILIYTTASQPGDMSDANFHGPHLWDDQVAAASRANFSWMRRQGQGFSNFQSSRSASTSPIRISTTTVIRSNTPPKPPVATSPGATPIVPLPPQRVTPPVSSTPTAATTVSQQIVPSQTAVPTGNGYGIAAGGGLIGLSQGELDTYFTALKALGVTWVRWDMDWSVIQSDNSSTYNWRGPDLIAATAAKYAINSLAIITIAPQWALDPNASCSVDQHCPPLDPAVFAHFASVAATRYKGVINTWEIWNEPNLNGRWNTAANGAGYPAYLKAAYTAIKQANPSAFVLSGGLAAAADENGQTSPTTFVRNLYSSGAKNYFDALALHPYSYPVDASYVAPWNSWQQMTGIRQVMVDNGDSAKKIWVTEYGAPTGGPGSIKDLNQLRFTYGADYMSESAQQQTLQGVMALYGEDKSWMGPFFWYSLKDNGSDNSTPENFFGLLRYDGSQKPAYQTFKGIIENGS